MENKIRFRIWFYRWVWNVISYYDYFAQDEDDARKQFFEMFPSRDIYKIEIVSQECE